MTVAIVVPYRAHPDREHLWAWCERRWRGLWPNLPIVLGTPDADGDFNRSQAINRGIEAAPDASTIIVADCDVAVDSGWLIRAVQACQAGAWALTKSCHYLTEEASQHLLASSPLDSLPVDPPVDYEGYWSWGGVLAFPRAAWERVGGCDERFGRWGPEDVAFGLALDALWAPKRRVAGRWLHLWHPAGTDGVWSEGVPELFAEYMAAAENAEAMAEVVARPRESVVR